MKMLGLTLTETAIICGTIPFIHGVTRTIIGGLADKMNAHKSVFMLLCLVTAISYGCMVFVPQRTTPEAGHRTVHVELHCWTNGAHFFVCNGGSSTVDADIEGESHGSVAARYISFNASVCRWTCSVEEQHSNTNHTETMLFIRPNQTDCLTVNQTATFEIGLGKLQRTTAENCRALTSPITDNGFCSCYTLQSFVVHDDTCEGMQCEKPTRLICKADCVHKKDVSIGGLGLHNDSRGLSPSDRTGIHFGWVFWSVAILYFLGQLTQQPLFGLNDAMLYTFLGDKRNTWGKQRLWGTIGFAVFGPISGLLMDNCSLGQNEYTVAFLLFVVFMLLTVFCACQHNVSSRRVTCSPQVFKDIVGLIRRPEAFVLFTLVLVFGMFMGVISTFLFWYLKLLRDVPQILFGLCILCSCSMEVFVLFFSDRVFRLISQVNCFSIACVVYAIRLASYSVIRNPWMVLIVEPLHAITFGLMYAAASTYVSSITPPGAHGSVQNIIASLHFCYGECSGKKRVFQ